MVKVEDDLSDDGFSVHKLTALQSTLGTFITSEWEKVKSADFVYMQDAYIERLQAVLITAERIEALDIVHPSGLYSLIGGKLKVQDAEIKGHVEAGSGKLGNILVNSNGLGYTVAYEEGEVMDAEKSISLTEEGFIVEEIKIGNISGSYYDYLRTEVNSSGVSIMKAPDGRARGMTSLEVKVDGIYRNGTKIL